MQRGTEKMQRGVQMGCGDYGGARRLEGGGGGADAEGARRGAPGGVVEQP